MFGFLFNKFRSTFKIVIKILFFLKLYDSIFSTLVDRSVCVCVMMAVVVAAMMVMVLSSICFFPIRFISLCAISFHIHH